MDHSEDLKDLAAALALAQAEITPALEDSTNPHFSSRFASLGSIWTACRKPLSAHGLSVVQLPEPCEGGGVALRTTLLHVSGQYLSAAMPLAYDPAKMQSLGSAITYARRYALAALVGVVTEADDDGNQADAGPARPGQGRDHLPPPRRHSDEGQSRYEERTSSGSGNGRENLPRTGKSLYAWAKKKQDEDCAGLIDAINAYGKRVGYAPKMIDWNEQQVGLAVAEAQRFMEPRKAREPGDDDHDYNDEDRGY